MNSSYEYMKRDLEFQRDIKKKLESELRREQEKNKHLVTEGHYLTSRVSKGCRYYYDAQHNGKKEKLKYIGKADHPDVVARQELHYLETALANCSRNIELLQAAVDNYRPIEPFEVVNESAKAYQENYNVGRRIFKKVKNDEWIRTGLAERKHYEAERPYPKRLVLRTACGEIVRTRGEIIIADALDSFRLPYVYEWPKWIGGVLRQSIVGSIISFSMG